MNDEPSDWPCERGAEPTTLAEREFAYQERAEWDAAFLQEMRIAA